MPSTDEIRNRICIDSTSPDYPITDFVEWMERRHYTEVLEQLQDIQRELNADEYAWQQAAEHGNVATEHKQAARWCAYCTQVRIHYMHALEAQELTQPTRRSRFCRWLRRTVTSQNQPRNQKKKCR